MGATVYRRRDLAAVLAIVAVLAAALIPGSGPVGAFSPPEGSIWIDRPDLETADVGDPVSLPPMVGLSIPGGGDTTWRVRGDAGTSSGPYDGDCNGSAGLGIEDAFVTSSPTNASRQAFDFGSSVWVNGQIFKPGATVNYSSQNRTVTSGPISLHGALVTVQYYMAQDSSTLRTLTSLTNPSESEDLTVRLSWVSNLGSDSNAVIPSGGTFNGDNTFTSGDRWAVTSWRQGRKNREAVIGNVLFGPGPSTGSNAPLKPVSVSSDVPTLLDSIPLLGLKAPINAAGDPGKVFNCSTDDGIGADFSVTIPAKASASLLFFSHVLTGETTALADAAALAQMAAFYGRSSDSPQPTLTDGTKMPADLLRGLPVSQLAQVKNWNFQFSKYLLTGPGEGGGSRVKSFAFSPNAADPGLRTSSTFLSHGSEMRGGARIAAGSLDFDAAIEYATAPGPSVDGHRRSVSAEDFASYGYSSSNVKDVSESEAVPSPPADPLGAYAGKHPDGSVVQGPSGVIYYLENGYKRKVISSTIFDSHFRTSELIAVGDSELALYPDGAPLGFREGSLPRTPDGKVWVISSGKRRHITSFGVFEAHGYSLSNVKDASQTEVNLHPEGDPVVDFTGKHLDGTVVRGASGHVYYLEKGKKRYIRSWTIFDSRFRISELIEVSDSELTLYPDGALLGFRDGSLIRTPDGKIWVIAGLDAGPPIVKIFEIDPKSGKETLSASFDAYPSDFRGGLNLAIGNVETGTSVPEIIVAPQSGPQPVKVFKRVGSAWQQFASFSPFGSAYSGGITVASGDVEGDGRDEIIVGAGPGATPQLKIYKVGNDGLLSLLLINDALGFDPYTGYDGGINVASANLDANSRREIVTAPAGGGAGNLAKVFKYVDSSSPLQLVFEAQGFVAGDGLSVATGDLDGTVANDPAELILGAGVGTDPNVKMWKLNTSSLPWTISREFGPYLLYNPEFKGGVFVGGIR